MTLEANINVHTNSRCPEDQTRSLFASIEWVIGFELFSQSMFCNASALD